MPTHLYLEIDMSKGTVCLPGSKSWRWRVLLFWCGGPGGPRHVRARCPGAQRTARTRSGAPRHPPAVTATPSVSSATLPSPTPPHPCLAARPPLLPQRARRWPGARRGLRGREPGARTSPHPSLSPSLPAAAGLWAGEVGLLPGSPAGCCSPCRGPAPPAPQPPSAARASDRRTLAAGSRGRPPKARRVDISVARAAPCPRQQSTGDPERQPAPRLLLQPPAVSWPSRPMFWHCWRVLAGVYPPVVCG